MVAFVAIAFALGVAMLQRQKRIEPVKKKRAHTKSQVDSIMEDLPSSAILKEKRIDYEANKFERHIQHIDRVIERIEEDIDKYE